MVTRNVTVNTTSQMIVTYILKRASLQITNNGAATVFFSENASSPTTDGTPLPSGASQNFNWINGDEPEVALYAGVTAGSADLRIIEKFGPKVGAPIAA